MGSDTLQNYYTTNFALMYHHKYTLTELDGMMPWERDVYISLLEQQLRKEAEERNLRNQQAKFAGR